MENILEFFYSEHDGDILGVDLQMPPPKTSPVISAIMGILNHHAIDNRDVEVHP